LRDNEPAIRQRGAEVVCVAPHDVADCRALVTHHRLLFPVLADEHRQVFQRYDVQSRVWSLGQRPAVYVIDQAGIIRWAHLGRQQWDIPSQRELLSILDTLATEKLATSDRGT
jgi:peroxiredoxin